jgi:putative ABC transport system permease protein
MVSGIGARLRSWWRGLRRQRADELEMEEEFGFHIEVRAADLTRSGVPAAEAVRRARLEFGSRDRFREEARQARGLRGYDELRSDVRYAVRSLARRPVFAAVAVLTLAVGVGANAAVFSLVNATVLRPLPFDEPDRLVVLHQVVAERDREPRPLRWSYVEYVAVRDALRTLGSIASYAPAPVHLSFADGAERTQAEFVSAAYFGTLRLSPVLGRWFTAGEDARPGANPVAVLSYELWRQQFGGDAAVMGRSVLVNNVPLEVIGVAAQGFRGLTGDAALWIPQAMAPLIAYEEQLTSPQHFHSVIGRLRDGVSLEQARGELSSVGAAAAAAARGPADGAWTAEVRPLDAARRSPEAVRSRMVLAGAVLLVLLIAAVNLAALLLARGVGRSRELALRTALGAGRRRLIRHMLTEGALIGAAGALLGALIAAVLVRSLAVVAAERLAGSAPWFADLTSFDTPALDWRVGAFTVLIALGSSLLAAFVPALRATRGDLTESLNAGSRGSTSAVGTLRRPTVLSFGAMAQIACALVLLIGAGLLLKAFEQLRSVDPGFATEGLITLSVAGPYRETDAAAAHALGMPLLEQVLERVQAVPGVTAATLSFCTPFTRCSSTPLYIDGVESDDAPTVGRHYVAPDHFRTLGVPLLRGRGLSDGDRPRRPRVAVINETAARMFWPGEDPIGRRVRFGSGAGFASPDSLTEIVGVAGDVVYGSPGERIRPDFYTSYLQFTWARSILTVRAGADPSALVPALRRAVAEANVGLEVHDVSTMEQRSSEALSDERFATLAVSVFAAIGLLLAALGVYGVMAYAVAQRRREIGIRLALGATRGRMLRLVVFEGLGVAAVGLLIGIFAAAALARVLRALLPNVEPADPAVYAGVAILLLVICALACAIPARSAARVDPRDALAAE